MPTSPRRLARILALQTLFEVDSVPHDPLPVLQRHLEDNGLTGDAAAFASDLVEGVWDERDRLDAIIAEAAPSWPMDQMAKVDKNVLRLAIYEVLYDHDVPLKAAINEAVELGKRFGSDSSSRFINGVLGTVAAQAQTHRSWRPRPSGRGLTSPPAVPPSLEGARDLENLEGLGDEL